MRFYWSMKYAKLFVVPPRNTNGLLPLGTISKHNRVCLNGKRSRDVKCLCCVVVIWWFRTLWPDSYLFSFRVVIYYVNVSTFFWRKRSRNFLCSKWKVGNASIMKVGHDSSTNCDINNESFILFDFFLCTGKNLVLFWRCKKFVRFFFSKKRTLK